MPKMSTVRRVLANADWSRLQQKTGLDEVTIRLLFDQLPPCTVDKEKAQQVANESLGCDQRAERLSAFLRLIELADSAKEAKALYEMAQTLGQSDIVNVVLTSKVQKRWDALTGQYARDSTKRPRLKAALADARPGSRIYTSIVWRLIYSC